MDFDRSTDFTNSYKRHDLFLIPFNKTLIALHYRCYLCEYAFYKDIP